MKPHAPAPERNREPLLAVLREVLPPSGTMLEIASGTGQHAAFFAQAFPGLTWQPTDIGPQDLQSIEAWRAEAALPNLRPALRLDVCEERWPVEAADAVLCVNMIHIAPWQACQALMRGAAQVLSPGGCLVLYGPYFVEGRPTAPSNIAFDESLRARNASWGVRELGAVTAEARAHGLELDRVIDMPSNNFTVGFRKRGG